MSQPHPRVTPATAFFLLLPPLFWAGNAVVGKLINSDVPPFTLNFFRWIAAFLLLLPFAWRLLLPGSLLWRHWRRYLALSFFGIGCYNALQYLALHSTSPLNVTLVGSSGPVFMLLVGRLFFGVGVSGRDMFAALVSMSGVAVVITQGDVFDLSVIDWRWGDFYMLLATFAWAFYSWQLTLVRDPVEIRSSWVAFLFAQITFGLLWAGLFAASEWWRGDAVIVWRGATAWALLYIAVGPAILAYRFWALGVERAGPAVAAFFANFIPLFAALISVVVLDERPRVYHLLAFGLIVAGIWLSSRSRRTARRM